MSTAATVANDIDAVKQAAAAPAEPAKADDGWSKEAFDKVKARSAATNGHVEPEKPAEKTVTETDGVAAKTATERDDSDPEERETEVIARRGLKRTGWTDEEIDTLPRATMLAKGKAAWTIQEKQDERFKQLRGGRKADEEDSEPAKGSASRSVAQDKPRGADPDLIPEDVLALLTEEHQEKLRAHVEAQIEKAAKPLDKKASQAAKALDELNAKHFDLRCLAVQRKLATEFPQLAGEKPPQRFIDKLEKLAPRYDTSDDGELAELFEDAARATFGKEQKQQVRQDMIEKNRRARSGAPDVRETGGTPTKPQSKDDFGKEAYDAIKTAAASGGGLPMAQSIIARNRGLNV